MTIATPVVLELEGMYDDSVVEEAVFAGTGFKIVQARLGLDLPTASVAEDVRKRTVGLFSFRRFLRAEDIALFPNLKVVVRMGVGYDRLDRVTLAERGVKVCNVPGTQRILDVCFSIEMVVGRRLRYNRSSGSCNGARVVS